MIAVDLQESTTENPRVQYEQTDVLATDDVAKLFSRIVSVHSSVEALVNNARIWFPTTIRRYFIRGMGPGDRGQPPRVFRCTQTCSGQCERPGAARSSTSAPKPVSQLLMARTLSTPPRKRRLRT